MKCTARILKEYKKAKADSMWPESIYGPTDVGTLPICGGDITVKIKVDSSDCPCCGSSPTLDLQAVCTKCKHPFWSGRIQLEQAIENWSGWDITSLLEDLKQ